jgi:cell division topological specificity factor
MKSRNSNTDSIAKERLKLMMESEPVEISPDQMTQMKKEISEIVGRYFEMEPDNYEIKVILKQNKKRA